MKSIFKKNKNDDLPFYEITDFIYYLELEKKLSKNTLLSYKKDITKYLEFIKKYQNINDVSLIEKEMIDKYINSLKRKELKTSSIARNITVIKVFHKFLKEEGITNTDIAFYIKLPKKEFVLPDYLSIDEINKMLDSIKTDTVIEKRNKAILELLYSSGLRVSELVNVKLSQLHMNEKYIVITGKGNKERIVPLNDDCVKSLRLYIESSREKIKITPNSFLFYNYKGNTLSRQSVDKIIKEIAKCAGIEKNVSAHTIRHTFATHMLSSGLDLRIVQELLGHDDIQTTQIYTHINNNRLKEVLEYYHPLNERNNEDEI